MDRSSKYPVTGLGTAATLYDANGPVIGAELNVVQNQSVVTVGATVLFQVFTRNWQGVARYELQAVGYRR